MQSKNDVSINGLKLEFIKDYKTDDKLRKSLNRMTEKIFGFSFENWYKAGYWSGSCIPYSLVKDGEIVSHVTVSEIDFIIDGKAKKCVQLGTVMTDKRYRNMGLSAYLLNEIKREYAGDRFMIFLYASKMALSFYPKFGFIKKDEYKVDIQVSADRPHTKIRKLDMSSEADRTTLLRLAEKPYPIHRMSMQNNPGLIAFYSMDFCSVISFSDSLYYSDEEDAAIVMETGDDGRKLTVYDIYSSKDADPLSLVEKAAPEGVDRAELLFTPFNAPDTYMSEYKDEGAWFVMLNPNDPDGQKFIESKLMCPIPSHT